MKLFNAIKKRVRKLGLGIAVAATLASAGLAVTGNTNTAYAASGNDIIYGGATSCTSFIDKVRSSAELQKIYAAFGLSSADYSNFAAHCIQGLANRDNTITVGGRVIATGVGSIGRWQSSQGANPRAFSIPGVGQTTFYGNYDSNNFSSGTNSIPVSLLLDPYGGVKFAAMVSVCGNPTYFTKVPHYACNSLVKTAVNGAPNSYDFSVNATTYNSSIDHIVYHFSDTNTYVRTYSASTKVRHTFARNGTVTATLIVKLPNGTTTNVMGNCITNVVYIPPPAVYACDSLTFALSGFNPRGNRVATFTAKAHATNATIKSYTINPGDGQSAIVVTSGSTTATATHEYKPGNYTATLTVTFLTNTGRTVTATSPYCQKPVSVTPQPTSLACDNFKLTPGAIDQTTGKQEYTLSAKANVNNATVSNFRFNFGDGSAPKDVATAQNSASVKHTYAPGTYTANAIITGKDIYGKTIVTTAAQCQAPVTVKQLKGTLTCVNLSYTKDDQNTTTGKVNYHFTANATADHATITSYSFNFGDNSNKTVTSGSTSVTTDHVYAVGNWNATVTVNGTDINGNPLHDTSAACTKHIEVKTPECKPGVPTGSDECSTLTCVNLTATAGTVNPRTGATDYSFTANATVDQATITSYSFNFGDNSNKIVTTGNTTATTAHTYQVGNWDAQVTVKGVRANGHPIVATSAACAKHIQVKTPECKPGVPVGSPYCSTIACVGLSLVPGAKNDDGSQVYTLNATASADNATITNYVFDFGDGSQAQTVTTGATTASTTHQYAVGTFTAKVTINGTDAEGRPLTNITSTACAQPVSPTPPTPKNPGIKLTKVVDGVKYKQVAIGQNFVYQLVITNTGEKDLTNAAVTDAAPAGVTMISADLGAVADNAFSYTIPSLAVGQSVTINITAVINAYVAGNVINTACVDTPDIPNQPGQPGDSCDQATVSVPPAPAVLPNTGAGSVLSIFGASIIVGTVGYRLFLGRRLNRQ